MEMKQPIKICGIQLKQGLFEIKAFLLKSQKGVKSKK